MAVLVYNSYCYWGAYFNCLVLTCYMCVYWCNNEVIICRHQSSGEETSNVDEMPRSARCRQPHGLGRGMEPGREEVALSSCTDWWVTDVPRQPSSRINSSLLLEKACSSNLLSVWKALVRAERTRTFPTLVFGMIEATSFRVWKIIETSP